MKTKIVKIGNSRGIRIPKSFIDGSNIENIVELEKKEGNIIIKPFSTPREGWDIAFQEMRRMEDDVLLDSNSLNIQTKWENDEWEW